MANWLNPLITSTYINFVAEVRGRDEDVARGFDPAFVTLSNQPTNTIRYSSAVNRWERWNGTAWVALSTGYAISITGNAATATALQTARTITIGSTGKSVDGSGNVSWTLAEIGAPAANSVINADGNYLVHDTRNVDTPTDLGDRGVRYEFKLNTTDGLHDGGLYHTVMTIQSWSDVSGGNTHQLGFGQFGNLWHRTAPIGGTWGAWRAQLNSANFNSFAPTLTGAGASGTWGINVTGNAGTVTNGVYTTGDQTIGGTKTFTGNVNATAFIGDGSQLTGINAVPAGAVMHFAMNSVPTGWLRANGATVSRTTFAALFAAIGTTYGAGDGSTTFNLPDLRGEFIRGWDDGRGVDSGRAIGTAQAHQMQSHTHTFEIQSGTGGSTIRPLGGAAPTLAGTIATSATGGTSNGSENRPRNVALMACIKF